MQRKHFFHAEGWEQHSDNGLKVFSILCSVEKVFSNKRVEWMTTVMVKWLGMHTYLLWLVCPASSFHLWLNEKWCAIPVSSSETRAPCFIPAKKGKKEKIETAGGGCYRTILMVSVQHIFEHLCSTCYFCFRVNLWGQDLNLSKMRLWYIWGHWGTVPSGTVFLFF